MTTYLVKYGRYKDKSLEVSLDHPGNKDLAKEAVEYAISTNGLMYSMDLTYGFDVQELGPLRTFEVKSRKVSLDEITEKSK